MMLKFAIDLAERGLAPDAVVRLGMRTLLAARLRQTGAGDMEAAAGHSAAVLDTLRTQEITVHPEAAREQHYEVPAPFFQAVLGPRLKYSSCLWAPGVATLGQAEEAMLELTARRARLEDGQRILELGCGWGSLTLWMAEQFPASTITAVCNSISQKAFIEERAQQAGRSNISVQATDVAVFEPEGVYDRVVSVEMFEHVRNWEALLDRVSSWLAPRGEVFLHVFCHRRTPYLFETDGAANWMGRYFFTGGIMPSFDLPALVQSPLRLEERWAVSGRHYARTCRAWLANQDRNRADLAPLFRSVYGSDARCWWQRWRMFFLACAELFAFRGGNEWLVGHYRYRL